MPKGRKVEVKFVQITAGHAGLYGLQEDGSVWKYYPAEYSDGVATTYAWWGRLTSRGSDATGKSVEYGE